MNKILGNYVKVQKCHVLKKNAGISGNSRGMLNEIRKKNQILECAFIDLSFYSSS